MHSLWDRWRRRYLLAMNEHRSDHTICRYNVANHSPNTSTKLQNSIRERIRVRMPLGVVKLKYSTLFTDDTLSHRKEFSTSLWIFKCFVGCITHEAVCRCSHRLWWWYSRLNSPSIFWMYEFENWLIVPRSQYLCECHHKLPFYLRTVANIACTSPANYAPIKEWRNLNESQQGNFCVRCYQNHLNN